MSTIFTINTELPALSGAVSASDIVPIFDSSSGRVVRTTVGAFAQVTGGVVDTTAVSLALTAASHAGKVVNVSSAAPIAITLPASAGTGDVYTLNVRVVATATGHTIKVANATDVMSGIVLGMTTSSDNVIGYKTTATDDTVTVNGTTKGGVVGDWFEFTDIKTGFWQVKAVTAPTGSTATPFSATV
jgi:hypothetical protein